MHLVLVKLNVVPVPTAVANRNASWITDNR